MAKSNDWLPASRGEQLAMALQWNAVLQNKADAWGVPAAQVSAFNALITAAQTALAKVQDKASRTHIDSVACAQAFKALIEKMRFIKNNYFNSPPRTVEELATLGLSERGKPSPIPKPENQVMGKTHPLGDHLLEVVLEIVGDMVKDTKASDYGFRVFAGVEDGAAASGAKGRYGKYLTAPPVSDTDFSWSFFTKRKREIFDYDEADRGKKAWFIVQMEQQKGGEEGKGPLGPLFWTIIP